MAKTTKKKSKKAKKAVTKTQSGASPANRQQIAVVGGGIAGLYCCWELLKRDNPPQITLFDSALKTSGRIESVTFKKHGNLIAEMGPMRVLPYPDRHRRLSDLVIEMNSQLPRNRRIRFTNFPSYSQQPLKAWEIASLHNDEAQLRTPLALMKLGLMKVVWPQFRITDVRGSLRRFQDWVDGIPFHEMDDALAPAHGAPAKVQYLADVARRHVGDGFWNVLAAKLSHDAVRIVLERAAFLHHFPENPNAADALVHWIRGMQTSDGYKGIEKGFQELPNELFKLLDQRPEFEFKPEKKLAKLEDTAGKVRLTFELSGRYATDFDHVILALPPKPLAKVDGLPSDIESDLEKVFPYPALKAFFVVEKPFWTVDRQPNQYQDRVPVRELHYRRQVTQVPGEPDYGWILAYSDRPACKFWAPYASDASTEAGTKTSAVAERQPGANDWKKAPKFPRLPDGLADKLINLCVKYVQENNEEDFSASQIRGYAVRDWDKSYVEGANHAWEVAADSVEIRSKIKAFSLGAATNKLHICGEAYSDLQAFIEGALRSAHLALGTV